MCLFIYLLFYSYQRRRYKEIVVDKARARKGAFRSATGTAKRNKLRE
jgi:hypothetical protein